jgi:hypothetical protein
VKVSRDEGDRFIDVNTEIIEQVRPLMVEDATHFDCYSITAVTLLRPSLAVFACLRVKEAEYRDVE